jgi:cytochrome c oxidase cbb3-type subunit 3
MMPTTMALFVVALVLVNVVGCVWLFASTSKVTPGDAGTTGHVWDGDLEENNNPLPRWWLWLFWASVAFSAAYLILFPGFGNFAGTLGWSQTNQYDQEIETAESTYGEIFKRLAAKPLPELAKDAAGQRAGRNIFVNNCATCHGSDGQGARGFPNLTDGDWLYGGDPNTIVQTITNGRYGVMAPFGQILNEQAIAETTEYVLSLSNRDGLDQALVDAGKTHFALYCAACHTAAGTGMAALGAPNLTDNVWLHGSSRARIKTVISEGVNNQMPAQSNHLTADRIHVVAAYVLSMGDGNTP